jgi:hypothetical protein
VRHIARALVDPRPHIPARPSREAVVRRILAFVLVAGLVTALVMGRRELAGLPRVLAAGNWLGLVAAALLQAGAYGCVARLYRGALLLAGVPCRTGEAWTLLMGSLFVNLVAPSAGAAGAALWIEELGRRGRSRAAAVAGVLLAAACDFGALTLLVAASLLSSSGAGAAGLPGRAGAAFLVLSLGAMLAFLWIAHLRPAWMRRLLAPVGSIADFLARRTRGAKALPVDWADPPPWHTWWPARRRSCTWWRSRSPRMP